MHTAYFHQLQSQHGQKYRYKKRGYAETVVYQVAGQLRPARARIVFHAIVHRCQFFGRGIVNDALVGRSRKEEGSKGQKQIDREDNEEQPDDETHRLVFAHSQRLGHKRRRLFGIGSCIFLCHELRSPKL